MWRLARSLPFQIVVAAAIGVVWGALSPGGTLKPLGDVGKVVIHWVKLVAGPFLFLTILASVAEAKLRWGKGLRLIGIALLNTAIAIAIGIGTASLFLRDVRLPTLAAATGAAAAAPKSSLGLASWLKTFTPQSLLDPFVRNEILLIALLALLSGIAVRRAWAIHGEERIAAFARAVERLREIPAVLLRWILHIIPLAVLCVIAAAVSEHGFSVFASLGRFVLAAFAGFGAQVGLVYMVWIVVVARIRPRTFIGAAREPVLYALGVNSSLATLPLTLRALQTLGVSQKSASLGAGVATNLNNDGIVLYEAQAAFFIALVHGIPLDPAAMVAIALTCIVASMGITGIPEAGFISLSVVVSTLGYPADLLPLLLAVDWLVARGRSAVNVLSDMTLSIALDATQRRG